MPIPIPVWIPPTDPLFLTTLISTLIKKPFLEDFKNPPKFFKVTGSKNKICLSVPIGGSGLEDKDAEWDEFEEPINGTYSFSEWNKDGDFAIYTKGPYQLSAVPLQTACANIVIWCPQNIQKRAGYVWATKKYPEGLSNFSGYYFSNPITEGTEEGNKMWDKFNEKLTMAGAGKILSSIEGGTYWHASHDYGDRGLRVSAGPRLSNPEENLKKAKEILDSVADAIKNACGAVLDAGNNVFCETPKNLWDALEILWE